MSDLTTTLENEILDIVLNNGTATAKTNLYLALLTSNPGEAGSWANEVSGTNYMRLTYTSASWTTASGLLATNSAQFAFPEAGGSWGDVTYLAIGDALANGTGTMRAYVSLGNTYSIGSGDTLIFNAGSITFNAAIGTSDGRANAMINYALRGQTGITYVATTFAALFTGAPGPTFALNEVSGGGYTRQQLGAADWASAAAGSAAYNAEILWPEASASWGTITYVGIADNPSGGNAVFYDTVTSKVINQGSTAKINSGSLKATLE